MSGLLSVLSVSAGTLLAIIVFLALVFWYVKDITQKKHTVLRNYPIIGRLRYFFEQLGEYFRQYFFTGDREEMPFNRSTRAWVYRLAKNEGGVIGFGSTYNLREPGALVFVNAPFSVLEEEQLPTPPLTIGEGWCERPFPARSVVMPSLLKGPPGKQKIIDPSTAHQIFGRAGRPQFDTEGLRKPEDVEVEDVLRTQFG